MTYEQIEMKESVGPAQITIKPKMFDTKLKAFKKEIQ